MVGLGRQRVDKFRIINDAGGLYTGRNLCLGQRTLNVQLKFILSTSLNIIRTILAKQVMFVLAWWACYQSRAPRLQEAAGQGTSLYGRSHATNITTRAVSGSYPGLELHGHFRSAYRSKQHNLEAGFSATTHTRTDTL